MPQDPKIYSFDVSRVAPTTSFTDTQRYTRDAEILRAEEIRRLLEAAIASVKRLFTRTAKAKTGTETPRSRPDDGKLAA